jgi:hypothetical protein
MFLPQIGTPAIVESRRNNWPANQSLGGEPTSKLEHAATAILMTHLAGSMLVVAERGLLLTFAHFYCIHISP